MNRSLVISISMAVLALVWVLSGTLSESDAENSTNAGIDNTSTAVATENVQALFKVKVTAIQAEQIMDRIELQGSIESAREIEVRAETEGTIKRIDVEKGDRLSKGQAILRLAMNDRQARLARARAELKVRRVDLKSGVSLKQKKLLSENQHQQNVANVVAAEAEVKEIEVEIEHTNVTAAFRGVLDAVHVELGDYVSSGTPLATLVDDQYVTISSDVPQQHVSKLKLGQMVKATLLDGTQLEGKTYYISSSADPRTRTFRIEAKTSNQENIQRFGQSARVSILVGQKWAHKLSPSLLNLSSDGLLQVKGVDADNRVMTKTVNIIRSENDGVWLEGLPKEFNLITVGQGFVSVGEEVNSIGGEEVNSIGADDAPVSPDAESTVSKSVTAEVAHNE